MSRSNKEYIRQLGLLPPFDQHFLPHDSPNRWGVKLLNFPWDNLCKITTRSAKFWGKKSRIFISKDRKIVWIVAQLGGGVRTEFYPPPSAYFNPLSWLQHDHLSIKKKKYQPFYFGASRIIFSRISNYFLIFDLKKVNHS